MVVLGSLLTLVVCGLAFVLGGGVERWGAALVLVASATALVGRLAAGPGHAWPVIVADLVMAAGLLALAVLAMRAWILVAIFDVALILIAHSLLLDPEHGPISPIYRALIDGLNLVGLAALLAGSVQSALHRRSADRRSSDGEPVRLPNSTAGA